MASLIADANENEGDHDKTFFALSMLAYAPATSPGRGSTIQCPILVPEIFLNSSKNSCTVVPTPEPKLIVKQF